MNEDVKVIDGVRYVRAAKPLHVPPRQDLITEARWRISKAIHDTIGEFPLSYAELQMLLADEMASWSQYQVREEWYGPRDEGQKSAVQSTESHQESNQGPQGGQ